VKRKHPKGEEPIRPPFPRGRPATESWRGLPKRGYFYVSRGSKRERGFPSTLGTDTDGSFSGHGELAEAEDLELRDLDFL
jgi:hypothetical protein